MENIKPIDKRADDAEAFHEQIQKYIEELKNGSTPQKAAEHSLNYKNTSQNYRLKKSLQGTPIRE